MMPILLIPGNMCDAKLWEPVAERLAAAGHEVHHAVRLEQDTIGGMAEATRAQLSAPSVVIGFSMGAIVAAEMARRAPAVIAALGLVAFNASADLPERAAVRPRQQKAVRDGRLRNIVADELKPNYLASANRGDAVLLDQVMEMAFALGPDCFMSQSEALRLRGDLRPALARFDMPVMLTCGSEDRLCPPEWHRTWAAMIGHKARFVEIDGAGHLVPLEQPQALADALLGWLAEERMCQTTS
jgi:pimeloyl-ACP methyl ester carboxylesterase